MQPGLLLKGHRLIFLSSASGCARRSNAKRLISWRKRGFFFVLSHMLGSHIDCKTGGDLDVGFEELLTHKHLELL